MTTGDLLRNHRALILRMVWMPVGLLLLLGFLFSRTYVEHIPFAIVDQDNSSLSRTVVRQFRLHPGFQIGTVLDSEGALEAAIRSKEVAGGLVIPRDFHRDLANHRSPRVLLVLDSTNVLVATVAQGYGSAILGSLNAGFEVALFEGKGLLPAQSRASVISFSFTDRVLYEPTLSYLLYLIYLMFLYTTQTLYFVQFLMPYLMDLKARWSAPGGGPVGIRAAAQALVLPAVVIVVLGVSTYLGLVLGNQLFGVRVVGHPLQHLVLMTVFLVDLTAIGVFVAALIRNLRWFLEAYSILALGLVLSSGVAWPPYMMPPGYAEAVQILWPLYNVAYPIKALHLKALPWEMLGPVILQGLAYAAAWGGVGAWLWTRQARPDRPVVKGRKAPGAS